MGSKIARFLGMLTGSVVVVAFFILLAKAEGGDTKVYVIMALATLHIRDLWDQSDEDNNG